MEKTTIDAKRLKYRLSLRGCKYEGETDEYAQGVLDGLRMAHHEIDELTLMEGWSLNTMIREFRAAEGVQQKDVAKACGISASNLCRMEQGKRRVVPAVWKYYVERNYAEYADFFTHANEGKEAQDKWTER